MKVIRIPARPIDNDGEFHALIRLFPRWKYTNIVWEPGTIDTFTAYGADSMQKRLLAAGFERDLVAWLNAHGNKRTVVYPMLWGRIQDAPNPAVDAAVAIVERHLREAADGLQTRWPLSWRVPSG